VASGGTARQYYTGSGHRDPALVETGAKEGKSRASQGKKFRRTNKNIGQNLGKTSQERGIPVRGGKHLWSRG